MYNYGFCSLNIIFGLNNLLLMKSSAVIPLFTLSRRHFSMTRSSFSYFLLVWIKIYCHLVIKILLSFEFVVKDYSWNIISSLTKITVALLQQKSLCDETGQVTAHTYIPERIVSELKWYSFLMSLNDDNIKNIRG